MTPLHSWWEYKAAVKVLEVFIMKGDAISENEKREMLQLRERISKWIKIH